MRTEPMFSAMRALYTRCFHNRNIIIVSQHKVKHLPISGGLQFCAVTLLAAGISWASYSTGSFLAARSALKEQRQALRSVTKARVETQLSALMPVAPVVPADIPAAGAIPLTAPEGSLAALDQKKLYARIDFLEHMVTKLKSDNEAFVQRVRTKTSGHIDDLESIIRRTGLKPEELEKEIQASAAAEDNGTAEGGPYIPESVATLSSNRYELYQDLDMLATLRLIVQNLPLNAPLDHYTEQSPFGHRIDPFTGHLAFHSGLDLSSDPDSLIHSTADGTVIFAGRNGAYGNMIEIDHGFGITTRYGHLSSIRVNVGEKVHKGETIGVEGTTGRSTGPHLHYEVRYHEQAMNPKNFLSAGEYVLEE